MPNPLLEARRVKKYFPVARRFFFPGPSVWVKALDDVSVAIFEEETLGLVGESGCGKTTLAKLILLLEQPTAGEILFRGKNLQELSRNELQRYRSTVQAVFQDPHSSLNPRMRVGEIIGEPLIVNRRVPKRGVEERVAEVMEQVGLNPAYARLYPHEFSGGQKQRIAAARALASNSKLIILDEPAASLDVSIRSQIINLFKDLQETLGLSYLLITHDLAISRHLSQRVVVMYLGKVAEMASADLLYGEPLHPYTKGLLAAALPAHPDEKREDVELAGEVPSPVDPPSGCRFRTRCPFVMERCAEIEPQLTEVAPRREVACHLYV